MTFLEVFRWQARIKAIERQYLAVRAAVEYMMIDVSSDPSLLVGDLRPRDLDTASKSLEDTYLVRMFAEFEVALRTAWHSTRASLPPTRMRDLIDGLAASCRIGTLQVQQAHQVRDYRNALVHERLQTINPVPLSSARSHLCHFLSRLY